MKSKDRIRSYMCHLSSTTVFIREEWKAPYNRSQTAALSNLAEPRWRAQLRAVIKGQAGGWQVNLICLISTSLLDQGQTLQGCWIQRSYCLQNAKGKVWTKISRRNPSVKCIFFIKYTIYHKAQKNKATFLLVCLLLFHLPARIPKLYKHVKVLLLFWRREERPSWISLLNDCIILPWWLN